MRSQLLRILVSIAAFVAATGNASAQADETLQEKLAAAKQSAAANQASLRQYQWVETTQVSLKGEVKSVKQALCLYGNDGNVQKTPVGEQAAPQQQQQDGGRRGARLKAKIVENKKDDLTKYMEQVKVLIARYVPPDPAKMQQVSQAGNLSLNSTTEPGLVALLFKNYAQAGDALTLSFAAAEKKIAGLNVNTYLDNPKDVVTLTVQFASLPDGTNYPGQIVLNATAKNIQVTISNTDYRKTTY